MTKLITAEEWQDGMDSPLPLAKIRDIQRNALEAAAKRVCRPCDEGILLDRRITYETQHVGDSHGDRYRCNARGIWKLHAELTPAPAGNERKGGGAG
jgi:hypothetical protein